MPSSMKKDLFSSIHLFYKESFYVFCELRYSTSFLYSPKECSFLDVLDSSILMNFNFFLFSFCSSFLYSHYGTFLVLLLLRDSNLSHSHEIKFALSEY